MTHALARHVHLAVIGDDVVLLDVEADSYSCMPDGASALRPSRCLRRVAPTAPEDLALLRGAGMLAAESDPEAADPVPSLPVGSLPWTSERLSLRQWARVGLCLWDLLTVYRRASFHELVEHVRRKAPPRSNLAGAEIALREAAKFSRALVWLPLPRKCLVRSFALLSYLRRSGVQATWVFGVRTWPFGAHCWVQLGDVALDDEPDRLSAYRPILAVPT